MCAGSPSGLRTFLELRYSEPGYAAASLHAGKHNRPNFRESPECELRHNGVLRSSGCHIETYERPGSLYHGTPAQER